MPVLQEARVAACSCTFCRACITEYVEGAPEGATCPGCEKPLSIDLTQASSTPVRPLLTL